MGRKGRRRDASESSEEDVGDVGGGGRPHQATGAAGVFQPPQRRGGGGSDGAAAKAGSGRRARDRGDEEGATSAAGSAGVGASSAAAAAGAQGNGGGVASKGPQDVRAMTSVALRCHHGRHVTADALGEVRASSSVVRDAEKFDLVHHADGTVSLRTCHGKYIAVEKNAEIKALRDTVSDAAKFKLVCHADGTISLGSERGYVAAEAKCGLRANRSMVGAWEKFQPKDRSRTTKVGGSECAADAKEETLTAPPLFDAFCQLQAVLLAEEQYARTRSDRIAIDFGRRARARRDQGLAFCFRHFRQEQRYTAAFRGCVSAWDATTVLQLDERSQVGGTDAGDVDDLAGGAGDRIAWAGILEQADDDSNEQVGPLVHAAFGIPAASAAEADEAAFNRLEALCRLPSCVAIGPVGLTFPDVPEAPEGVRGRHAGLDAAAIAVEFGANPGAAYDAQRDPACVAWLAAGGARAEDWMVKHGDRRLGEFTAACADYERRRCERQVSVVERQLRLAKELKLPVVVQLPPQVEAERRMAELLVAGLGDAGCEHPVLLSAFQGRPRCVAALLQHFPNLVVGFSGLLTHSKMRDTLGEVAFDTPLQRIVLESLGPRYPPAGADGGAGGRGSFGHPAHVALVAAELAKVKKLTEEEVLNASLENAKRLFGLPRAVPSSSSTSPPPSEKEAAELATEGCAAAAYVAPTRERLKGKSPFLRPKDIGALFAEIDADGDGRLGPEDLRSYLVDFHGYGVAEARAFSEVRSVPGDPGGVDCEAFKKGLQDLNAYSVCNRSRRSIVRQPGAFGGLSGVDFHLEDCTGCDVWICDRTEQFFADNLAACRVLVGPCASSTFVRNCTDCKFWVATRQLRTRDCTRCTFYLHCHTEPIIEKSTGLVFAPFAAEYPGLVSHFNEVKFNAARNFWSAIYDFSGKAGKANWRIQPLEFCELLSVRFDGRPDLVPERATPELSQELLIAPPPRSEEGSGQSVANIPQTRPPPPPAPRAGTIPQRVSVTDAHDPEVPAQGGAPGGGRSDADDDDDDVSSSDAESSNG